MSEAKEISVSFKLIGIRTSQFATFEDKYKKDLSTKLNSALNFSTDPESKTVVVSSRFDFTQKGKTFLMVEAECMFSIEPDTWEQIKKFEADQIVLPRNLATHFAVLTIGTTRGVLHAKTENTHFNNIILPTVNVTELITNAVTLPLS